MEGIFINRAAAILFCVLCMTFSQAAEAHVMVTQHGTLNVVDDGAYMALSLPVSAFEGVDDNNDGSVSVSELERHRSAITHTIKQKITLQDTAGNAELKDIMLTPESSDNAFSGAVSAITIMGRFSLNDPTGALQFNFDLFGKKKVAQLIVISASHKSQNLNVEFTLTPANSARTIFTKKG